MTLAIRLLLAALAVYRLAQLIAYDDGPADVFLKLRARANPQSSWGKLVVCPYCLGVWLAALLSIPVLLSSGAGDVLLCVLGLAGAQALLEGRR